MKTQKGGRAVPAAETPDNQNTQLASSQNRQLAEAPDEDFFADYADAGLENVTIKDILVPRIAILQDLSPQVKEARAEYIEGAKPGMICDVGTRQLLGHQIAFVPTHYSKVWIEWYPRKTGQGIANIHTQESILDSCVYDEKRKPMLENGNYISETAQLFGLQISDEGRSRQVYIPFTSTQLKKSKMLLTLATSEKIVARGREITPPLFYRCYIFSTVHEDNAEGDWFGWKIERGLPVLELPNGRGILETAIKMRMQVAEGTISADMSSEEALDAASASNYERPM